MFVLDESSAGDQGNAQDSASKQYQNLIAPLMFIGFVLSSIFLSPREQKQVSLSFLLFARRSKIRSTFLVSFSECILSIGVEIGS